MNQEPKIKSTLKKSSVSSNSLMNEKTREKYSLESKKAIKRSFKNGAIAGLVLTSINLTNGKFGGTLLDSFIEALLISFIFTLFVTLVSFFLLKGKLNSKYNAPNTCRSNAHYNSNSALNSNFIRRGVDPSLTITSSSLSRHDSDPSYPGSNAWYMRRNYQ